jgi:hypothetical protein
MRLLQMPEVRPGEHPAGEIGKANVPAGAPI